MGCEINIKKLRKTNQTMSKEWSARVRLAYHISVLLAALFLLNFVVAGVVMQLENGTYTDAFYLTMSATTLAGFSEANTDAGKWFISCYQVFGALFWQFVVTTVCLSTVNTRLIEAARA